ncbi:ferrochelatase [Gleimia sp. 6138-11-ORH1]|uniref:ferrochelatase n=1 Tax=Gleimia sp. 6138-11-ORH1 TaxID=2973937 RepID=UPI00216A2D9A|nr:ferrochelatase [Gleimia sp. 6138-11-ORH1]MCS4484777.1 ferrochelatase [Gleimia sp. 6138-11-ORH1]
MSEKLKGSSTALVIVNLGTPSAPEKKEVRQFLREFLSDRRVIEYSPILWRPLLEGIILRVRPKKVAHAYQTIWTDAGSPLLTGTLAQVEGLATHFQGRAHVTYGMCYGDQQLQDVLEQLTVAGYQQIAILPAYPQYSASTVGAVYDQVARWTRRKRNLPSLRLLRSFPTATAYIESLAVALESHWETAGRPNFAGGDRVVASYHSIPQAMHDAGDPYWEECEAGAKALAERLNIPEGGLLVTYQSVFGPAKWIGPTTIDTVAELGEAGTERLDVICPGFMADCLETLEEIAVLNRETYEAAGGKNFHYVPWANGEAACINALAVEAEELLAGWV